MSMTLFENARNTLTVVRGNVVEEIIAPNAKAIARAWAMIKAPSGEFATEDKERVAIRAGFEALLRCGASTRRIGNRYELEGNNDSRMMVK